MILVESCALLLTLVDTVSIAGLEMIKLRVNRRAVSRTDQGKPMKAGIHPEYQTVIFHDTSVDEYFMTRSTLKTNQTIEWKDGKTYPYCTVDTSSASHPFYTGQQKILDTGGRVDRFNKRFGNRSTKRS